MRDAQTAFNSKFRPTAQVTRSWFGELVALGYGVTKKLGKSLIFQKARSSDPQFLQTSSNSFTAQVSLSEFDPILDPHFLQTSSPTEETEDEVRTEVRTTLPLQDKSFRSIVGSENDFATSKKSPTDENVKEELI